MAIKIDVMLVTDWREEYRTVLAAWQNQAFELWNCPWTEAQLRSIWAQIPSDTSLAGIINLLGVPMGLRQPWANPGANDHALNIKDLPDADIFLQLNSYELVNPPISTSANTPYIIYKIDDLNYFTVSEYASSNMFLVRNGVVTMGVSVVGCFGLRQPFKTTSSESTTKACRFAVIGKTSDGIIFTLGIVGNKNNSGIGYCTQAFSESFLDLYNGAPPAADPFSPGGTTHPGGAEGSWTITSDPIDFPSLPPISVANAGFVSIWTPTLYQIVDLANFMWSVDPLKVEFWKKLIANPMELIMGLHLLPFEVEHSTLPENVTMGFIDTGIEMYYTDQQFQEVDCGTIHLTEYWGAFLDYAPYTHLDIFLPFIGVRSLNVNDCMPKDISLKYRIDIATGTCVAIIKCDDSVLYHYNGSCAAQIPVTANQMQEIVRSAISLVTSTVGGAVTGGLVGGASAALTSLSSAASNTSQHVSRSGSIGGTSGFMSCLTPYLIVTRPRQALPEEQTLYTGYPSFMRSVLSTLEGYTEVEEIHLENVPATDGELSEIENLLKSGVIL